MLNGMMCDWIIYCVFQIRDGFSADVLPFCFGKVLAKLELGAGSQHTLSLSMVIMVQHV